MQQVFHQFVPGALGMFPRLVPLHRRDEFVRIDGFQQVVQRAEADGLNGKLDVGGGKNDVEIPFAQGSQEIETVHTRHLDVEKHQIGLETGRQVEGRARVGGHTDISDLREVVVQEEFQHVPGFGFVVDDEDFHGVKVGKMGNVFTGKSGEIFAGLGCRVIFAFGYEKFKEIKNIEATNEEYYHVLLDSLTDEFQNYDKYYPNNLRYSILVQSYSFLEYYLKRICDHIYYANDLPFKVKDLNGNGDLEKSKIYLAKTCALDFGSFNPEWVFINNVKEVRNAIAHSRGEFDIEDNKYKNLVNFIKSNSSLSVKEHIAEFESGNTSFDYEIMILDENLNIEFIENIRRFYDKITKAIFER